MFGPINNVAFQDPALVAAQQQKNQVSQQQKDMADALLRSTDSPLYDNSVPQTKQPDWGGIQSNLFSLAGKLHPNDNPENLMSWGTGKGPLPWLQQNQLPWLKGGQ